jgi:hypothetical protein
MDYAKNRLHTWIAAVVDDDSVTLTPHASDAPPFSRRCRFPRCIATMADEQAVSTLTAGPGREIQYK